MFKVIATNAIVSKGYEDKPALKFAEGEKSCSVRFRIGQKVYDSREPEGFRWLNFNVKAFGALCERIKKMKIKEGSWINFSGHLDEDVWTDKETNETHRSYVIVMDDIEYATVGKPKDENDSGQKPADGGVAEPTEDDVSEGQFTGYESFGGGSFFDD